MPRSCGTLPHPESSGLPHIPAHAQQDDPAFTVASFPREGSLIADLRRLEVDFA
jgi:hypothetical protein